MNWLPQIQARPLVALYLSAGAPVPPVLLIDFAETDFTAADFA